MNKVYAIVPAAGHSRRMGTQKLLLPFAGTTVIEHVIAQLSAAPVRGIFAVVRATDDAVAAAASRTGATPVVNPDADADMLSSVRCGIRALPPDCDAALVALGDQPTVRTGLVSALLEEFARHPASIVVPSHAGRRGHPVLFPSECFADVLTRYDGVGLKGLLEQHAARVRELRVDDETILHDVDDPEGYARALRSPGDGREE